MSPRNRRFEPSEPVFRIDEHQASDGTLILSLYGDLDIQTAPTFTERLHAAIAPGAKLVLDFNALDFMDSSGLAVLLAATKHAREQSCDISLVRPQDGLLRLFRVAGVDTMLPVQPDRGDEPTRGRLRPGRRAPP